MKACPAHPFAILGTGQCIAWGRPRELEVNAAMLVPLPEANASAVL
ncbi:hypothetical protein BH09MYX1_BH09MYX1_63540 [soil metagenome]